MNTKSDWHAAGRVYLVVVGHAALSSMLINVVVKAQTTLARQLVCSKRLSHVQHDKRRIGRTDNDFDPLQ